MSGAPFLLAVNFIIAACFGAVFATVARHSRHQVAATWIAAAFGVASLSSICELLVAYTDTPKVWAIGAFATVLAGMVLLHAGISGLYGRKMNWWLALSFVGCSLTICYTIYDLPRGTPFHAFLYQSPFALVILSIWLVVVRSSAGSSVDRFLALLLFLTGMHFFAKAELAVLVGSGTTAKDYVHTNYALISQSSTAVLIVSVGLTLLAHLVLGIMFDQRTEAEKDGLSGLRNRRAFERAVHAMLGSSPHGTHALILCDLDHFKRINDDLGHLAGDQVIKSFGNLLIRHAPPQAIIGRVGGEEFAIVLPDADVEAALPLAQSLRAATTTLQIIPDNLHITASFGISALTSMAGLTESYRQADAALYKAKSAGRNRVKIAAPAPGPQEPFSIQPA